MNAMNQDFIPAKIEAERAVLGGIMVKNDALRQVPHAFDVVHFFERIHRDIYSAILRCLQVTKNANPVTIRSFMSAESASQKIVDISISQHLAAL